MARIIRRATGPTGLARVARFLLPAIVLVAAVAGPILLRPARASAALDPAPAPLVDQSSSVIVTVNPSAPTAGQPVSLGYSINLTALGLAGNVGWSFGDSGTVSAPANQPVTHTFSQPGTYIIQIAGVDSAGNRISGQTTVRVAPAPLSPTGTTTTAAGGIQVGASFVSPPGAGKLGVPLTFTATSSPLSPCGTVGGYSFNFGDNSPSATGQTVTHTYTAPGTYTVTLTTSDCPGSTNASTATVVISPVAPTGVSVSYQGGWNLVSGTPGTVVTGNTGSLFTYQAGDTAYETLPTGSPLQGGEGYWAYFPAAASSSIAIAGPANVTVQLPPGQPVMIGNPGNGPATVGGADSVLTFDPRSNNYAPATVLQPGQGAWAISNAGGAATISNGP